MKTPMIKKSVFQPSLRSPSWNDILHPKIILEKIEKFWTNFTKSFQKSSSQRNTLRSLYKETPSRKWKIHSKDLNFFERDFEVGNTISAKTAGFLLDKDFSCNAVWNLLISWKKFGCLLTYDDQKRQKEDSEWKKKEKRILNLFLRESAHSNIFFKVSSLFLPWKKDSTANVRWPLKISSFPFF